MPAQPLRLALMCVTLAASATGGCGTGARTPACTSPDCTPPDRPIVETLVLGIDDGMQPELPVTCDAPGLSFQQIQVRAYCQDVGTGKQREVTRSPNLHWKSGNLTYLVVDDANKKGLVRARCFLPHGGLQYVTAEGVCGRAAQAITFKYTAPNTYAQNAPPGVESGFNGAPSPNPGDTPRIVYPLDGAMHPSNIRNIVVQWKASASQQLFRWRLLGENIYADFYVGASGTCSPDPGDPTGETVDCAWRPPADKWGTVVESVPGDLLVLSITGTTGIGGLQAESAPITLNITPQPIRGTLHYFSPSIGGIKRFELGTSTPSDAPYPLFPNGSNSFQCVGCHALSPDGKKMAATFYGLDGFGGIVDAQTGKRFLHAPTATPYQQWNWASFSPDGKLLLTSWKGVLTLRDGDTGARKFDVEPAITRGRAIMPEWSPDGTQVAFVRLPPEGRLGSDFPTTNAPRAGDWVAANTGDIAVMRFERGAFRQAEVVVLSTPGVEYHYAPSFSPDSRFLLFVSATAPGNSPAAWPYLYNSIDGPVPPEVRDYVMTYDQRETRLRLVDVQGGDPIELTAATHQLSRGVSWPRFTPFQQDGLAFLTFSSRMDVGFSVTGGKTQQIWMSAVDLRRATLDGSGTDPSYPPVWLPFQDPRDSNHGAVWTWRYDCYSDDDCSRGHCVAGVCQPWI